jgi:FKBP-type peptidyl-prolyl cis-trans isomerase
MKRPVLCALLVFTAAARAQDPEEREARERGVREHRETAPKGKPAPGDDEALYALGAILGARVSGYGLSPEELGRVQRGFADAAANRKLRLRDPDLEEWGPKVDAMLQRRGNPVIAAEKERGRRLAEAQAKTPGASSLSSGVVLVPLRTSAGPRPAPADRVRVKYEGRLADGTRFDQSDGAEFRLDRVIGCWTEAVQRMSAGAKARLICPSATAYGDQGRPPHIPGGATLIFEVELLAIVK